MLSPKQNMDNILSSLGEGVIKEEEKVDDYMKPCSCTQQQDSCMYKLTEVVIAYRSS